MIQTEALYKNGKIIGEFKEYYSNGELKQIINYVDGKREGKYFAFGVVIMQEGYYSNNAKNGEWIIFYRTGTMIEKRYYNNGILLKTDKYDKEGNLIVEG